jgi:glucose/arabinose dehydrogenase
MRIVLLCAACALAVVSAGAGGAATPTSTYRLALVARSLPGVTGVVAAPRDRSRLYVVQRRGLVRVLQRGRLLRAPFLDIRGRTSVAGEQGLLSLAFDPDFARTGLVYVFYTGADRGELNIVEYRATASRADPATARSLVTVEHPDGPFHNGGQLLFGPDGRLYAGAGDGGYLLEDRPPPKPDPRGNSQNLGVLLGKIFALNPQAATVRPQIVAYGLRNPWRFAFHPTSRDLIIADVGFNRLEEVDVLRASTARPANFGWSVYEGRARRPRADVALNPAGPLIFPSLTYGHARGNCSITGGFVYRGSVRRLRGRYVFGDYCSGRVWSVVLRGARAVGLRLEPVRVPGLTTFGEDARGELYAGTLSGRVYRFTPRR